MGYLTENSLLNPLQFGYRKIFSTTDALLLATGSIGSIKKNLDQYQNVAAVFLDLWRAFVSISHELLLQKLKKSQF